jgi:hypothetical protein
MANKRQTFFSQYRGRGGPAIEPGIIQMMGSIGEEYAKGIRSFGEDIGDAISERDERIRQENATEFFLNWGKTEGTEDSITYGMAKNERDQRVTAATTRSRSALEAHTSALAQTGERGDSGKANELRNKIDNLQTEIGDIRVTVFQKDKAIDVQNKKLTDPDRIRVENYIPQGRLPTPEEKKWLDVWDTGTATSSSIKKTIKEMVTKRDKLADKLPSLLEDFNVTKRFWQMESANPGSSKGMNAAENSEEYKVAIERLNVFRDMSQRTEVRNELLKEEAGDISIADKIPVPFLKDVLPEMFSDKPEVLARLLNYERPTPKSMLVEDAKREVVAAEIALEKVSSESPLRRGDFQRPLTDIEKVKRLYDEKKKYPKDFGEKVISFLQKTKGPQYKVINIGGAEYLLTNQGATRLGADDLKVTEREKMNISQKAVIRKETKENRESYDADVKRIRTEISEINQKTHALSGEGINAEDIRRKKELEKELISVEEEFKASQSQLLRDIGGDISDPYTDEEILQIR